MEKRGAKKRWYFFLVGSDRTHRTINQKELTWIICVFPTPEEPRKATLSGPFLHDVSVSPSRVNRYAVWCAIHFFCIKSSMSIAIRSAHFLLFVVVFALLSTNLILFCPPPLLLFRWLWGLWNVMCVCPLIKTAFKFFSVDGESGKVLPFHILQRTENLCSN